MPSNRYKMAEGEDEDIPVLSDYALAALKEFYLEQVAKEECEGGCIPEDWQLSQFWYDNSTAEVLAEECLRESNNGSIACISCPTLFLKILEMRSTDESPHVVLLEFDKRFSKYGDQFIYYDYNAPLDIPDILKTASFDLVAVDPPFLSEECLTKVAQTVHLLTNKKILLCTGSNMSELALTLLGTQKSSFIPVHSNNLANEFSCFVNYNSRLLNWTNQR